MKKAETSIEEMLQIARELRPDLWDRTESIAKIIAPEAFVSDWIIPDERLAAVHNAKLKYMRSVAMSKAQTVLEYLGVNTETDWHEILTRMVAR